MSRGHARLRNRARAFRSNHADPSIALFTATMSCPKKAEDLGIRIFARQLGSYATGMCALHCIVFIWEANYEEDFRMIRNC